MMAFQAKEVFPGIWHIRDALGVCMTLITGEKEAILADAGYGLESVKDKIRSITALPCRLILTHGHHDHALGAMNFEQVWIDPSESGIYRNYTAISQRRQVLSWPREPDVQVDEAAYLEKKMPEPSYIGECTLVLGSRHVQVIHCPGHTPGSLMFYVHENRLLITGDNWNPCTWLFFPEALDVLGYRANMRNILKKYPFEYVLCSHLHALFGRNTITAFFEGLTDERLAAAVPTPEGDTRNIRTGKCEPAEGQQLIFDLDKYAHAVAGGKEHAAL